MGDAFSRLQGLRADVVPYANRISQWNDRLTNDEKVANQAPPSRAWIPEKCDASQLFPTHPQSSLKRYHARDVADYETHKLPTGDEDPAGPCVTASKQAKPYCLRSSTFQYTVQSDTFADKCGNLYRGYVAKAFLTKDDNDGTLNSLGRSVYPKPGGDPRETEPGYTQSVKASEFVAIGPPLAGDAEAVARLRERAAKDFDFDPEARVFTKKKK